MTRTEIIRANLAMASVTGKVTMINFTSLVETLAPRTAFAPLRQPSSKLNFNLDFITLYIFNAQSWECCSREKVR